LYESSLFTWEHKEASQEKSIIPKTKLVKRKSISEDENDWETITTTHFFTPDNSLLGRQLRLNCIPSDGKNFGLSFKVNIPEPVQTAPVNQFLYQFRMSEMGSKLQTPSDLDYIRVISYNILADTLATPEWFVSSPPECLDSNYRVPLIAQELNMYQGDILCLQEVDEKLYEGTYKVFFQHELNCEGVFSCKTGNTSEGVVTFCNRSKFTILQSQTIAVRDHLKTMPLWREIEKNESVFNRVNERNTVLQLSTVAPLARRDMILLIGKSQIIDFF